MSFKTVLVHLEHQAQSKHLLKTAVRIAAQHQAHLIGTYIMHPVEPYVGRAVDISVSAEISQILATEQNKRAAELAELFEAATKGQNFVAEWRFIKDNLKAVTSALPEQGRAADLIMVSGEINDPPNSLTNPGIASEELLKVAADRGADCMVMGAYGHSRMHSILLGGLLGMYCAMQQFHFFYLTNSSVSLLFILRR